MKRWRCPDTRSDDFPPPSAIERKEILFVVTWLGSPSVLFTEFFSEVLHWFINIAEHAPLAWRWLLQKALRVSAAESALVSYSFGFTIQAAAAFDL